MGLTPLEGLPGATRSGTVDPSLVFHYTTHASHLSQDDPHISKVPPLHPGKTKLYKLTNSQAEEILNKHSGWASLTGTPDFAALTSPSPPPNAALAFTLFVDRITNLVAAYFVKLRGRADALVFAGGVGERSWQLREAVVDAVACLGFEVRREDNEGVGGRREVVVSVGGGGGCADVLVCRTDEAREMARGCVVEGRFWGDV